MHPATSRRDRRRQPHPRAARGRPDHRRRAAALAAALATVLSACSGGGSSPAASTAGRPSVATSPASPTPATRRGPVSCRVAADVRPGRSTRTLDSGGVRRTYLLDVPPEVASRRPLPLVLSFHGFRRDALSHDAYTGLGVAGTRAGYLVVTPQGVRDQWNFVRRPAVGPDDVAFVSDLLDAVSARLCVDPRRVFATGISDGADMANAVACALPDRVAAVAPVAASVLPEGCAKPAPSMLEIHGTADRVVPYLSGGPDRPPPFQGTRAQPAEQRLARWAALVGCRGGPTWTGVTGSVRFLRWACGPGRDVGLLAVAAGGHTWPGAAPDPALGPTTGEISANRVILLFFRGHPQLRAG